MILIKIKNLFNYLVFLIIHPLIKMKKIKQMPQTLLIIRLDAIGDYVLFRNFLKILRESEKYKKYKITLCGNILWKELSENLDEDVIDNFIWIDRKRFYGNLFYKYRLLKEIHEYGFEVAIEATYSREILYGDEIVKVSMAKERIGSIGAKDKHAKWKRNLLTDKWYTNLISSVEDNLFEFDFNKQFFKSLLGKEIDIKKPFIDVTNIKFENPANKDYVVLFPGVSTTKRRWDIDNFLEVAGYIINNTNLDIVIDGSKKEIHLAQYILNHLKSSRIVVTAGTTSLSDMAKLISGAKLLISNDTSAIHFSAAVNTKFICISNGAYYSRFHPYPEKIFDKGYYVYPDEIKNSNKSFEELSELYRFDSNLDINSISSKVVITLCEKLLLVN